MIILNLKGGTGNQLFQFATARHLAVRNQTILKLESQGLARANEIGDIYRPLSLQHFAISATIASAEEVRLLKYPYGIISKAWRYFKAKVLRRYFITFDSSVLSYTGDIFLDGYFQSPLYFNDIRDTLLLELTLRDGFSPAAATYAEQIKTCTAVSLHVRRGDYVKNPRVAYEYGQCSNAYFAAAIAHIEKQCPSPTYYIFSDDIKWVKNNLPVGTKAVFVEGTGIRDVDELMLMSLCTHNIIANSSFSWWGAWLNQNPDKIVIAPTPWHDRVAYDKNLIPQSWVLLPKS